MGDVIRLNRSRWTALEFFSGIGLARAGLAKAGVDTIWANDMDPTKNRMYSSLWGGQDLAQMNVFDVCPDDVPSADIAWASSPCTDLSLAGKRDGLVQGRESSAFFGFTRVLKGLGERRPSAIVLENVTGLASSHDGDDFRTVVAEFNQLGYSVDAFEIDARRWLPQSRPRMFVVGLEQPLGGGKLDSSLRPDKLAWIHSDDTLVTHLTDLPSVPELKTDGFTSICERMDDDDPRWWGQERCQAFISSLSAVQKERFERLRLGAHVVARTAYRRTRSGKPVWEIRPDDIAGCLRTARGGSSKQAVVMLGNGEAKMRWMTGWEYAALQGAGDLDVRQFRESQIQYAFGDAVAVPVVTWLIESTVTPSLAGSPMMERSYAVG